MGKVLIIKGADFSANGMQEDFIITRSHAFTTVDQQKVNLCQLANFSTYDFSNVKIEIVAQLNSFTSSTTRDTPIFGGEYDYIMCTVDNTGLAKIKLGGSIDVVNSKIISLNTDYTFTLDTYNKTCTIGDSTESFSGDISTGSRNILNLFSGGQSSSILDIAGRVKIKSVKIWNPTTNVLLANIKAASTNDGDGLYDTISESLLNANTGVLGVD